VTATTSVRWQATEQVCALLRSSPSLTGVTVEPGWPGDRVPAAQLIWFDEIDGAISVPVMTGGRKQRADTFTLSIQIRVIGLGTLDETMSRLFEIVGVVENLLADDTSLGDLDGVLSAELTNGRQTSAMFPEGPAAYGELILTIETRLL
jgi:hypothetical protein